MVCIFMEDFFFFFNRHFAVEMFRLLVKPWVLSLPVSGMALPMERSPCLLSNNVCFPRFVA